MTIKTSDGERSVASQGLAGTALGFGIGGAALSLLGGNGIGGLFGNSSNQYISKEMFALQQENQAKDLQISILTAQSDVDKKLVDVYTSINDKVNAVRDDMNTRWEAQAAINTQQAVYNASNNSQLSCLTNQVAQLQSMTKLVIPNSSVSPGWGTATVTVGTSTTTA